MGISAGDNLMFPMAHMNWHQSLPSIALDCEALVSRKDVWSYCSASLPLQHPTGHVCLHVPQPWKPGYKGSFIACFKVFLSWKTDCTYRTWDLSDHLSLPCPVTLFLSTTHRHTELRHGADFQNFMVECWSQLLNSFDFTLFFSFSFCGRRHQTQGLYMLDKRSATKATSPAPALASHATLTPPQRCSLEAASSFRLLHFLSSEKPKLQELLPWKLVPH